MPVLAALWSSSEFRSRPAMWLTTVSMTSGSIPSTRRQFSWYMADRTLAMCTPWWMHCRMYRKCGTTFSWTYRCPAVKSGTDQPHMHASRKES
eukprot:3075159-Rhodomonas_salina.1